MNEEIPQSKNINHVTKLPLLLGTIGILLISNPTKSVAQFKSDLAHTISYQETLPISAQAIVDIALPKIQQLYNQKHPKKTDTIQINIVPNYILEHESGIHTNDSDKLLYRLDMHHVGAAIDMKITTNGKTMRLGSKEGIEYTTIIDNITKSMGLTALITDQNQIHVCVTDKFINLLKYYPELYNHSAIVNFYNHFKDQDNLDQSHKSLIELMDRHYNGEITVRTYKFGNDDINSGGGNIHNTGQLETSGLLNPTLPQTSH